MRTRTINIRQIALFFLMICLMFLVYLPSLKGEFIFDDDVYVVHNPGIRDIFDLKAIGITAAQPLPSRYVVLFTFALNYHLSKLAPFPYHLTNVIIHILTALLLFVFIKLLLKTSRLNTLYDPNQKNLLAIASVLIFALHPVQTQAVSYISQRCVSLATMFYMASLCFYLKGRYSKKLLLRSIWLLGCLLLGLMSMFTKEIAITLPLMIITIELFFNSDKSPRNLVVFFRKRLWALPVLLGMFIIPIIMKFSIPSIFTTQQNSQSHEGDVVTFGNYIVTEMRVAVEYLRLFILPVKQNFDYDFRLVRAFSVEALFSYLILIAAGVFAFVLRKKKLLAAFGIFWFFITLLPEFVPRANVIFEHKLYLLSIGLSIAIAEFLLALKRRQYFVFFIILIVFVEGFLTFKRNYIWKDSLTLWQDVVLKSPGKSRPLNSLGLMYFNRGDIVKAFEYFNKAIAANGANVEALNNRGVIYRRRSQNDLALMDFSKALSYRPNYAEALNNRGVIYKQMGKDDLALEDFLKAAEINPTYSELHFNMGLIFENRGEIDKAQKKYEKAIETNPKNSDAYNHRGIILARKGLLDEALKDFETAVTLNNNSPECFNNLGSVFYLKGDINKAIINYTQAISLRPDYVDAYRNRAVAFKTSGKYTDALNDLSFLINNSPTQGIFYKERAALNYLLGNKTEAEKDIVAAQAIGYTIPENFLERVK